MTAASDPVPEDITAITLFSYGTLRQPDVQQALFGRLIAGEADVLDGFRLGEVRIVDSDAVATSGAEIHRILRRADGSGDLIVGLRLSVSVAELAIADHYEGASYARIAVTLRSGAEAFVYVAPE